MKDRLDAIGIGLSSLCLIHCLFLPVLVLAVPSLVGSVLGSEWIHILLIGAALPVSIGAFWRGLRCHGCRRPGVLGALGFALLAVAVLPWLPEAGEIPLTVLGVAALASGHLANRRLRLRA